MNIPLHSATQLSAHLKSLRKSQSLTQSQLGARIGIKQTRMADIEKNPGLISVDQLLQVLHALDARLLLAPPVTPPSGGAAPTAAPADW